jgi:hypothetical protein
VLADLENGFAPKKRKGLSHSQLDLNSRVLDVSVRKSCFGNFIVKGMKEKLGGV